MRLTKTYLFFWALSAAACSSSLPARTTDPVEPECDPFEPRDGFCELQCVISDPDCAVLDRFEYDWQPAQPSRAMSLAPDHSSFLETQHACANQAGSRMGGQL